MRHKPLIYVKDGLSRCQPPDFIDLEHLNVGETCVVEINEGKIIVSKTHIEAIPGIISPTNRISIIDGGDIEGCILILRCKNTTMINNTGNLRLKRNFVMNNPVDTLMLIKAKNEWLELSRSNNS